LKVEFYKLKNKNAISLYHLFLHGPVVFSFGLAFSIFQPFFTQKRPTIAHCILITFSIINNNLDLQFRGDL